jgi:hypothetical protein
MNHLLARTLPSLASASDAECFINVCFETSNKSRVRKMRRKNVKIVVATVAEPKEKSGRKGGGGDSDRTLQNMCGSRMHLKYLHFVCVRVRALHKLMH